MLHIQSCILLPTLGILTLIAVTQGDETTGLCPSGFPRRVAYGGFCFEVGMQGPCGPLSVIASNPENPNYGICRCKDYGSDQCFGRPLINVGKRCYFSYSQGPCQKGQWLVQSNQGRPMCRKTPCPLIESQRDLLNAEFPQSDFYFTMFNGNKCFKTGTRAFCKAHERVYFLGTDQNPQCMTTDPYNCDSSIADGNQVQGDIQFGAPYDGI